MSRNIVSLGGKTPRIHDSAFIAHNAVIIGDVEIGPDCGIWYNVVLRGDLAPLRVGANTNIQDGTVVHVDSRTQPSVIGDNVTVGHMALIHAATLHDGCMVGMKATVMDEAVVESGALVAAGAVVTPGKRVGTNELWAGTPARFLREVGDSDRALMDYILPVYRDLADQYIAAGLDLRAMTGDDEP